MPLTRCERQDPIMMVATMMFIIIGINCNRSKLPIANMLPTVCANPLSSRD